MCCHAPPPPCTRPANRRACRCWQAGIRRRATTGRSSARASRPPRTSRPRCKNSTAILSVVSAVCILLFAADPFDDKFRQLDELLPTPTTIRTASGAPGHAYWQQRADYTIRATLDEAKRSISGAEHITYHNNSPDTLNYLWVQLDQNMFRRFGRRTIAPPCRRAKPGPSRTPEDGYKFDAMRSMLDSRTFDGGFNITAVKARTASRSGYVINKTMMRIDLPQPLKPGQRFSSASTGATRSTSRRCWAAVPATSSSTKTRTTCSRSPSGSRAWPPTTTSTAGSTSSSWAPANSRSNSATTTCS
jgi:hypothetical protein